MLAAGCLLLPLESDGRLITDWKSSNHFAFVKGTRSTSPRTRRTCLGSRGNPSARNVGENWGFPLGSNISGKHYKKLYQNLSRERADYNYQRHGDLNLKPFLVRSRKFNAIDYKASLTTFDNGAYSVWLWKDGSKLPEAINLKEANQRMLSACGEMEYEVFFIISITSPCC
nr:hypothetical protein Iba_chr05aCG2020 [Ipomoea batatas]